MHVHSHRGAAPSGILRILLLAAVCSAAAVGQAQPAPVFEGMTTRVAGSASDEPSHGVRRFQGFYNTDERMGVELRLIPDRTLFEFNWARIYARRISLGIFAEAGWIDAEPEMTNAAGGGGELQLFPVLPGKVWPFGGYLSGRAGGRQNLDATYQRLGGSVEVQGEAGLFARLGGRWFLLPRVAIRRTHGALMRKGRQVGEWNEDAVVMGLEARVGVVIPGLFAIQTDSETAYVVSLRFAYR